jgi:hypothetical protein
VYEAGVMLLHETQTAALVRGENIDVAAYMRLSEELQKLVPPPKPIEVKIDFAETAVGIFNCKYCGKRNEIEDYVAPPKSNPAPATSQSGNGPPTNGEAKASAPAPAPAPAPPPPPPRLDPSVASGSGFHNQVVGGERAPLKRLENVTPSNNGHARSGAFDNYHSGSLCWVAGSNGQHRDPVMPDPNPQRTIVTPLPTPKGNGSQ